MDLKHIKLNVAAAELPTVIFSDYAQRAADYITPPSDDRGRVPDINKSTQLRKFYDELSLWHDKVMHAQDRDAEYQKAAPFIQMLKAKAAYAQGRGHVNARFTELFQHIIGEIGSPDGLKHAKLFFEAVLGFRKALEQK
ncbi:CRISPR-associated protein Csm2 [Neisseria sp. HSC-16F19]|nr:type III-A CRISPR-associated protein Csm2 [Neisseria sp. HSC-16F19]MCP2041868.1 CRISPR-associated protein Csm2 [Neisseria sp. HSC-16F19]